MRKIFSYKNGKYIAVGAAGILLAASVSIFGVAKVSDGKANKSVQNNGNYNAVIPSAGIAVLMSDEEQNTQEINGADELSGGIASALNTYYNSMERSSVSLESAETVLKFLPQQDEEQAEAADSAGTENAAESEEQTKESTEQAAESEDKSRQQQTASASEEKQEESVTSVVDGYTVLGVANVENYLNVRETPDTEGELLGKLPMNAGCEILETLDGWYKVSSGNVEGYVSAEFLLTGKEANERAKQALSKVAHVNADMLMVREEPNTVCSILTRVAEGEELEVADELDGWVKVNIDDVTGYVSADYVDVYNALPRGVTLKELSYGEGVTSTAVDLIEYAKQFLGNPYVYGGTSLTNGTDCSGFTMRIFEHFGYSLSRTSREQAFNGTRVSLDEIRPGDLLFYYHGSSIGHVAIYIGNGQIIHASTERTGIIIGNAFYTTPACATRIIN